MPQPLTGVALVLAMMAASLLLWAYSGFLLGLAFLSGAVVMCLFIIARKRFAFLRRILYDRQVNLILSLVSVCVFVYMFVGWHFGVFLGVAAIFGYFVGVICASYRNGDAHDNHDQ